MTCEIHVATTGCDDADGSPQHPLRTINRAAALAMPGDTVVVHEGTYREWVRPQRGGASARRRITYCAAPGEHVAIKGSEQVTGWTRDGGDVWTVTLDDALFGGWNPYALQVEGDWLVHDDTAGPRKHLGEVYLDGHGSTEVASRAEVAAPPERTHLVDDWTGAPARLPEPDRPRCAWYAEVTQGSTTLWVNFRGADPNASLVEVNVRRSVFSPVEHHIDHITVRGFELAHAATPWAPPTADQPGLVGPNWAKGWVIEDNHIHHAKCSAVSLGKEGSTGHHLSTTRGDKPGYQYQLETVFAARQIGWDAEHIGSHVVRRNTIHHCGQTAVVGHLGCAFSTIEDNHIHSIATEREFYGYEIAGIKLHAAIDVVIRGNRIHDCSLGTWLDWQAQGTRVTRNVYYRNHRDLFVEVSHGPYLVDHNVLASPASLELFSQGGAFVHNAVCGTVSVEPVLDRPTPYHLPHSTQVAGYAAVLGGDDRYLGNIFLGGDVDDAYGPVRRPGQVVGHGTDAYDGHPCSLSAYLSAVADAPPGDHERFAGVRQPVHLRSNAYGPGARGYREETGPVHLPGPVALTVTEEGDRVYLDAELPASFDDVRLPALSGLDLEPVRLAAADFEERDGSPAVLTVDITGAVAPAGAARALGPVAGLTSGRTRTRVW